MQRKRIVGVRILFIPFSGWRCRWPCSDQSQETPRTCEEKGFCHLHLLPGPGTDALRLAGSIINGRKLYGSSNSGEPLDRLSGSGGLSSGRKVKTAESLVWGE